MRDQAFVTDCVTPHPLHRWHLRLGHLGVQQVAKLKNSGAVTGVNISNYSLRDLPLCDGCVLGKMRRADIPKKSTRPSPTSCVELVSGDICVMGTKGLGGYTSFVVFVCHASRRNWVYF